MQAAEARQAVGGHAAQALALGGGPVVELDRIGQGKIAEEIAPVEIERGAQLLCAQVGAGQVFLEPAHVQPGFRRQPQGVLLGQQGLADYLAQAVQSGAQQLLGGRTIVLGPQEG